MSNEQLAVSNARPMKDSGVEWIGEIPEEWDVAPLKSLFSFGKGLPITKEDLTDNGVAVISYGQIHSKTTTGVELQPHLFRFVSEQYLNDNPQSLVNEGDFIVADTSEDYDGCGNAVFVDKQITLFAGYHTIILRHKPSTISKYLAYLFRTDCWRSQIRSRVYGIKVFSVSQKILNSTSVILPSLDEQRRIADFLDCKCAEIDRVVAETEKTIEEYKALRQSVITEAVTKGVRGNRPMKDSGVEWIGEIPEEWEIGRLQFLITYIESGTSVNAGQQAATDSELGVLKTSCVSKNVFLPEENKAVNLEEYCRVTCPVCANTLIVSRMNTPDLVGAAGFVERDFPNLFLPDRLWQVHFISEVYVKFYFYWVTCSCVRNFYSSLAVGTSSSMQNISQDQFYHASCPILPLDEQQEIADYLDTRCAEIDRLIAAKQQLLTELESYKKSIIYEYVTGKREVPYGTV